ncbi:hypothetical protein SUGI_0010040 [Cryptomeria japonica]|nr:hypothetical protein SUGI_0010040 [Cryptomeria japonica]
MLRAIKPFSSSNSSGILPDSFIVSLLEINVPKVMILAAACLLIHQKFLGGVEGVLVAARPGFGIQSLRDIPKVWVVREGIVWLPFIMNLLVGDLGHHRARAAEGSDFISCPATNHLSGLQVDKQVLLAHP